MSVSVDPATGRTIATHVFHDAATVDALLDRAVMAQRDWAAAAVATRATILRAIGAALRDDAEVLAQTITAEMGKPIVQARAEVDKCAGLCDWYADHGPTTPRSRTISSPPSISSWSLITDHVVGTASLNLSLAIMAQSFVQLGRGHDDAGAGRVARFGI